jgi:hypothetical protein
LLFASSNSCLIFNIYLKEYKNKQIEIAEELPVLEKELREN